jgi:hypothetical protein
MYVNNTCMYKHDTDCETCVMSRNICGITCLKYLHLNNIFHIIISCYGCWVVCCHIRRMFIVWALFTPASWTDKRSISAPQTRGKTPKTDDLHKVYNRIHNKCCLLAIKNINPDLDTGLVCLHQLRFCWFLQLCLHVKSSAPWAHKLLIALHSRCIL